MSQMLTEAQEAPARVREFLNLDQDIYADLGRRLRELDPAVVATIARGSSDHAAAYASYLIPQCTGRVVASIPPSVVTVLKSTLNLKNQFALAISQSGSSPDIVGTLDCIRKSGALTAALVNDTSSALARTGEVLLGQHAGVERGLAATKTVLCTLTAIARFTAEWAQDRKLLSALRGLPDVLEQAVQRGLQGDDRLFHDVSNVYVLSRGLGLTSALETSLKIKETCGLHAEAFSTAEVRHGPREIVDRKFLVIAFALPDSGHDDVVAAARELEAQGARLLLVAPASSAPTFVLPEVEDPRLLPIVALQTLYPWFARCSRALGRDPDHPKMLKSKVIQTI